jgi:hypothetical protein
VSSPSRPKKLRNRLSQAQYLNVSTAEHVDPVARATTKAYRRTVRMTRCVFSIPAQRQLGLRAPNAASRVTNFGPDGNFFERRRGHSHIQSFAPMDQVLSVVCRIMKIKSLLEERASQSRYGRAVLHVAYAILGARRRSPPSCAGVIVQGSLRSLAAVPANSRSAPGTPRVPSLRIGDICRASCALLDFVELYTASFVLQH